MASAKILEKKQQVVEEIKSKVQDSTTVVLFDYRGLTDEAAKTLRRELRDNDADYKVYKNTLMSIAFKDLNIDLGDNLTGPSAMAFGNDQVMPIKVLSKFAKEHPEVILKVGVVDNEVADKAMLDQLSSIPSRDALLTMLAGGMIGLVKDLSICLDLYAKEKEENE